MATAMLTGSNTVHATVRVGVAEDGRRGIWSRPWRELTLRRRTGWIAVARHLDNPAEDRYWCGDADPGGLRDCLECVWLDRTTHASAIAVYRRKRDVTATWLAYQHERHAIALPALRYRIEPWPLAWITDWERVPARGLRSAPHEHRP